jgi:hypothetical protein
MDIKQTENTAGNPPRSKRMKLVLWVAFGIAAVMTAFLTFSLVRGMVAS